jgi:hypothetical protein
VSDYAVTVLSITSMVCIVIWGAVALIRSLLGIREAHRSQDQNEMFERWCTQQFSQNPSVYKEPYQGPG